MTLLATRCTAMPVCDSMRYSEKKKKCYEPGRKCLWSVFHFSSDGLLHTATRIFYDVQWLPVHNVAIGS